MFTFPFPVQTKRERENRRRTTGDDREEENTPSRLLRSRDTRRSNLQIHEKEATIRLDKG
ncbi:hypothetical protein RHMOL_Rhmol04G0173000 [Rhododendron molle]|uniref:Uncharacterized protein n=1 Tax=Rhododendron molle TaxID=49168 RepID=A0ACC0P1B7_RHOML|nr:hypothetical protein RHMOL_Rhmol04G0173000 [Rhododendron molle]